MMWCDINICKAYKIFCFALFWRSPHWSPRALWDGKGMGNPDMELSPFESRDFIVDLLLQMLMFHSFVIPKAKSYFLNAQRYPHVCPPRCPPPIRRRPWGNVPSGWRQRPAPYACWPCPFFRCPGGFAMENPFLNRENPWKTWWTNHENKWEVTCVEQRPTKRVGKNLGFSMVFSGAKHKLIGYFDGFWQAESSVWEGSSMTDSQGSWRMQWKNRRPSWNPWPGLGILSHI